MDVVVVVVACNYIYHVNKCIIMTYMVFKKKRRITTKYVQKYVYLILQYRGVE